MKLKLITLILFLFCVSLVAPTNAAPERYQWIFSDDMQGYFFDTQSIKYDYNQYTKQTDKTKIDVWVKIIYSEAGVQRFIDQRRKHDLSVKGFENLSYSLYHNIFSSDKKVCDISFIHYSEAGEPLDQYTFSSRKWEVLIPDSIGEDIHREIWKYSYNKLNSLMMELEAAR